jgi:hypothetical protein
MWLGEARGHAVDWLTQRWVQLTGRRVVRAAYPWLDGPAGKTTGIGATAFDDVLGSAPTLDGPAGLLPAFGALAGPTFDPASVAPAVAEFYEQASAYEIDAWAEWTGVFRPFGVLLAVIFSRRLQQLNVPLSSLETSRGMTSRVRLVRHGDGRHRFTVWVRELVGSGHVIYAGAYSVARVPEGDFPCVRVVFPLPNGNATVLMSPSAGADGSLLLTSSGRRFGSPGFYFTVHYNDGTMSVRYLRTMRETIHVYPFGPDVRADHTLTLWRLTFLRLHYRLRRRD